MTLVGKTAVVTGGSRGIGRAIVRRLAADGVQAVFSYRQDKPAADAVAADAVAICADQEDPASLEVLFEPVAGGLDILVNNAAVNPGALIRDITPELFDTVMTVNAKFSLLAMRKAEPLLRDGGRIISISAFNTAVPAPGLALYAASKAALEQFTKVAARELGPRGITVNTISPGATDTDLLRSSNPPKPWSGPRRSPPWAAWAGPPTLPTRSPSSSAPTPGGSPARTSTPRAASYSDPTRPPATVNKTAKPLI